MVEYLTEVVDPSRLVPTLIVNLPRIFYLKISPDLYQSHGVPDRRLGGPLAPRGEATDCEPQKGFSYLECPFVWNTVSREGYVCI